MLRNILSERIATAGLVTILSLVLMVHFLILIDIIPFTIVWGGRLNNREQAMKFETVAILATLLMLLVVVMRSVYLRKGFNPPVIRVFLWLMTAMFLLNSASNFFSYNIIEQFVFTPLTALLSLFSLRLAISSKPVIDAEERLDI